MKTKKVKLWFWSPRLHKGLGKRSGHHVLVVLRSPGFKVWNDRIQGSNTLEISGMGNIVLGILAHPFFYSFCLIFQEAAIAVFYSMGFCPGGIGLAVEADATDSCDRETGSDGQSILIGLTGKVVRFFLFSFFFLLADWDLGYPCPVCSSGLGGKASTVFELINILCLAMVMGAAIVLAKASGCLDLGLWVALNNSWEPFGEPSMVAEATRRGGFKSNRQYKKKVLWKIKRLACWSWQEKTVRSPWD